MRVLVDNPTCLVRPRTASLDHLSHSLDIEPRETGRPTMTHDIHRSTTAEAVADEFVPAREDRALSFGAALVAFTLSMGLMSTLIVLLSA